MDLNIEVFKEMLYKITLKNRIPSFNINVSEKMMKSKMISPDNNAIVIINKENTLLTDVKEELSLTFLDPQNNVLPYVNLINNMTTKCKIDDLKLNIKDNNQNFNLFFCYEESANIFGADNPIEQLDFFYEFNLAEHYDNLMKTMKIATKHKKIYITIENHELFIESTDKTNPRENTFRFKVSDVQNEDVSLMFKFEYLYSLLTLLKQNSEQEKFTVKLAYFEDGESGIILFKAIDDTENYYFLSNIE